MMIIIVLYLSERTTCSKLRSKYVILSHVGAQRTVMTTNFQKAKNNLAGWPFFCQPNGLKKSQVPVPEHVSPQ